ncbi:MAG: response regulator [Burkholderiales bacterium]|nr:response regulator [Burkholderiales bacterium]
MPPLERVMVVEDDPDIRDILELSLGTLGGYTLSLHSHAQSAIEAVAEFAPQLIVLDVMLPDMSGPEALPLLREGMGPTPTVVVFLTATAGVGVHEEFMQLGAQEVMFKPFDPVALPGLLEGVWCQHTTPD